MSAWTERRGDAVAEAILDAAEDLFATHGPGQVSMAAVAAAAGCSRATLYRHFENRHALQMAFAARQARSVVQAANDLTGAGPDRAVRTVLAVLAQVRSRPTLASWITPEHHSDLLELLLESPWTATVAGVDDPYQREWVLRSVLGLLACPAAPEVEEQLVRRFIAPLLHATTVLPG